MKTYLFDFDGTIVDSMPTFVSSMLRILDENGISYEKDIIKAITPLGLEGTADYFLAMGLDMPKEALMERMGQYLLDAYWYHIPAKNNVVSVLKALKEQGNSLNVLTASPHITLDRCMARLGLFELFDNVWSCDDFGTTKANPEIYRMVAQQLGVPVEEILFLDDNLQADLTAKSAGMQVCGVYDPSSEEFIEEMKRVNDYYIYDFTELLQM